MRALVLVSPCTAPYVALGVPCRRMHRRPRSVSAPGLRHAHHTQHGPTLALMENGGPACRLAAAPRSSLQATGSRRVFDSRREMWRAEVPTGKPVRSAPRGPLCLSRRRFRRQPTPPPTGKARGLALLFSGRDPPRRLLSLCPRDDTRRRRFVPALHAAPATTRVTGRQSCDIACRAGAKLGRPERVSVGRRACSPRPCLLPP